MFENCSLFINLPASARFGDLLSVKHGWLSEGPARFRQLYLTTETLFESQPDHSTEKRPIQTRLMTLHFCCSVLTVPSALCSFVHHHFCTELTGEITDGLMYHLQKVRPHQLHPVLNVLCPHHTHLTLIILSILSWILSMVLQNQSATEEN